MGHRCQKHPLTKTATFSREYAISGFPGRLFDTSFLRRSLTSVNSGVVPERLLDFMTVEIDFDDAFGDGPTGFVEYALFTWCRE